MVQVHACKHVQTAGNAGYNDVADNNDDDVDSRHNACLNSNSALPQAGNDRFCNVDSANDALAPAHLIYKAVMLLILPLVSLS